jgi:drug/metabolite transporter (DMT)-like permease
MEPYYLMLLGLFVTVAGTAWYNREAQNPVLAAVAVLALVALWACYQLGPDREGDNSAEEE